MGVELESERMPCALRLAGNCHSDHGSRVFIKNILAENDNRPQAGLLFSFHWMKWKTTLDLMG